MVFVQDCSSKKFLNINRKNIRAEVSFSARFFFSYYHFNVTASSLEHGHKKQKNILMTMFRNTQSRHEKLEVFFQNKFFL